MKRTDIAMIVLIASLSVLIAYFTTKSFFGDAKGEAVTVKTIDPITPEVNQPDERVFHSDAINPTIKVQIGKGEQP